MASELPISFQSAHCTLTISRPRSGVVLVVLEGRDLGELGDAPFRELSKDVSSGDRIELFIDARAAISATMDVSGSWAVWLGAHKERFEHVSMLTGSRFIQLSAEIVRNFSALGDTMRLYTEAAAFDAALALSAQ
jgi:hypothetical protein